MRTRLLIDEGIISFFKLSRPIRIRKLQSMERKKGKEEKTQRRVKLEVGRLGK